MNVDQVLPSSADRVLSEVQVAERLGVSDGDRVRGRSRHGEVLMPVTTNPWVKCGELFATFHAADVFLNNLTSPHRDKVVMTPEYKVVAVAVKHA